jgi:hypothetical protein
MLAESGIPKYETERHYLKNGAVQASAIVHNHDPSNSTVIE